MSNDSDTALFGGEADRGHAENALAIAAPVKKTWSTPKVILSAASDTANGPGAHPDGGAASLASSLTHS